jgi:hypothetical protein
MSNSVSLGSDGPPALPSRIIFVSYRRGDAASASGRLFDGLEQRYGADAVFLDVEGILPSDDFVQAIRAALARTAILVVVIGPDWLRQPDPERTDYVVEEVKTALEGDIPIVPVLVEGGSMPDAADLPEEVRALATRDALTIHHDSWDDGFRELTETIERRARITPVVVVGEMRKVAEKTKRGCSVQLSVAVTLAVAVLMLPILIKPAARRMFPVGADTVAGFPMPDTQDQPIIIPSPDTVGLSGDTADADTAGATSEP